MKITIDLPEEEIMEMAKAMVAEHIADAIKGQYYDGRVYRNEIKAIVREVIRKDIDNLSDRAVQAASKSIENRAVKKMLDQLKEG